MMNNTKKEFKFFTIPQYQQEEKYLSEMHEKGWRLTKIGYPCIYHFEKCEPAKVTYRLDYNQEGVNNKSEYVKMFSDCGWDYMFDFVGYSYFRKEGASYSENEEIFCDAESRLDMMKRVFRGRVTPLILIFIGLIIPQLCLNTNRFNDSGLLGRIITYSYLALTGIYLLLFTFSAVQFYQYEKLLSPEEKSINFKYAGIFMILLLLAIGIGYTIVCLM